MLTQKLEAEAKRADAAEMQRNSEAKRADTEAKRADAAEKQVNTMVREMLAHGIEPSLIMKYTNLSASELASLAQEYGKSNQSN